MKILSDKISHMSEKNASTNSFKIQSAFILFINRTSNYLLVYQEACLAACYLSSKRPFAQSFDIYLTQVWY